MNHTRDVFRSVSAVVAIPVRDEAERITDCLLALGRTDGATLGVVLLVNNTTDGTIQAIADVSPTLSCPVVAIEHSFAPESANAGEARRLAMQHADRLAPEGVPLLTTDADGRVEPGWLAANMWHLRHGADAVFGQADIDPVEAARIPPALHKADAEECAFASVLDQIDSLLDPDPVDPWPRHTEHSGASIAVLRAVFARTGGIPAEQLGEDRAFAAALRRVDARIRHARDARVVVSGRILGRAPGGMADTIRRRLVAPDTMLDDALEPAEARVARIRLRVAARAAFQSRDVAALEAIAARVGVVESFAGMRSFGQVWAVLDRALPRRRVAVAALPDEMALAVAIRDRLVQSADLVAAG